MRIRSIAVLIVLSEIIILNCLIPLPDSNDVYELSRICSLMDSNIKYCINNNWGFGHPLSCWLISKVTDDLISAQRLVNAFFFLIFMFVVLKLISFSQVAFTWRNLFAVLIFMPSPWIIDLIISLHIDIAPITLVLSGILLFIYTKRPFMIVTAGALVGSAYWFRFHFLSFALLFPFFTILFKKENGPGLKMFIRAAAGVLISVLVPHLLCLYSYGIFSISNEKFILAQALGIADWSYEFSCKLETLTTADMFKEFDWKLFVLKYCYHFVKSGIFLFLIIYGIALWGYLKERIINGESINRTNRYYQLIMIASYGLISVVPFTVIRGFTYRLEAAFIVFQIPLIVWTITNLPKNYKRAITITLLTAVCYHLTVYGKSLSAYEDYVVHNQKLISENIPASILKERPQDVVCCVDYYNPYNKYKICNPMVYAGWGVRFKPLIENFGFLNLRNPYGNPIYKNAKYIVLPSNTYEFNYDKNILKSGNVVFKDDDILIISRETKDKNL